jgi:hypothetical protein
MKIAGIDVSRNAVTVCILEELPRDLKRFKSRWKPMKFKADQEGISDLLKLEFDAAILEPTGYHYSKLWAHHLIANNRDVRWVGHWEVASYREAWKCFNKSDKADAIALACYGLERWDRPQFFLSPCQQEIKQLYLQLESLNRIKNPIANRLRQQLTHQIPEIAEKAANRSWLKPNPPGIWLAISGEKVSKKWSGEFDQTIGTGLSPFSRGLAAQLCQLERQEYDLECLIAIELAKPEYAAYMQVFERFDFGERTSSALLGAIYPIEQFLNEYNRPIIEHVETKPGKRSGRNRSLSAFKLACGVGMTWHQSGDYEGWKPGGRSDVRRALWRWCMTVVLGHTALKTKRDPTYQPSEIIARLKEYYEHGSTQVINGETKHFTPGIRNQKIMRVVRRALEQLFRELVQEIHPR